MGTFVYRTATMGAAARGSTIDAPDRAAAVRALMGRGETPLSVEEVGGAARGAGAISPRTTSLSGRVMSRAEMASFVRELGTALMAGLPLIQALKTIARQGRSEKQREMLRSVIEQVEAGKPLADAMAAWGRPFAELTISLTNAGEQSGKLAEVLMHTADLLDRDLKLRRSIVAATIYPAILCGLVVIAVIVVVTFIVPNVLKQLAGTGVSLPWPTLVVKNLADFFAGYWWAVLLVAGAATLWWNRYYASPQGRLDTDRRLLRVPALGSMLRDVAVARFTRTLGTLTRAGIPIVQSLRITRNTLGNRAMEKVIDDVVDEVSAGKTIAEPMERSGYFPPMLVQIVNLGERSGRLDELLNQASNAFEEKTEQSVKLFTVALPPVLVVGLACVVGFIVMAILLALLQVQDAALASGGV